MKELVIVGPTASGKSALAIELAQKYNACILSLDSLSIYKEIDIVSAKPSKEELSLVKHYGIDVIYPNQHFSIERFIALYDKAKKECEREGKNLIIAGGSVFYLKALLSGLSPVPEISLEVKSRVEGLMRDIEGAYELLKNIDKEWAKKVTRADRYRIEKLLQLYFQTSQKPSDYFLANKPTPIIRDIPIFTIETEKEELIKRLVSRTDKMIKDGVVEEIFYLEKRYTRAPAPMKAVGIKETLQYLDGRLTLNELKDRIVTNSAKLAKRQRTFIKTQIPHKERVTLKDYKKIEDYLQGPA